MSLISVTNVEVLNNPARFTDKFQFEISFECIAPVKAELEWKLVYVGSAEDDQYDQELDSVLVGPIIVGKNKFVFEADAPDAERIPAKDLMEVTVLLLTCAYQEKEFIRIGYYVNNDFAPTEVALVQEREAWLQKCADLNREYSTAIQQTRDREEQLRSSGQLAEGSSLEMPQPPSMPQPPRVDINKLTRNILADKPRVTRFQIPWDEVDTSQEFAMDAADEAKAAEAAEGENEAPADSTATPIEDDDDHDEEDNEEDDEEDADVDMDELQDEGEEADEAEMQPPGMTV